MVECIECSIEKCARLPVTYSLVVRIACSLPVIFGLLVPANIALYRTNGAVVCIQPSPIPNEKKYYIVAGHSTRDIPTLSSCRNIQEVYSYNDCLNRRRKETSHRITSHENTVYIPVVRTRALNVESEAVVANFVRTDYTVISEQTASQNIVVAATPAWCTIYVW